MKNEKNKPIYALAFSAVMIGLGTALSMIKIIQMPLGGSVTLLSMLPVVMISLVFGLRWGLGSAFAYSLIQLFLGITMDGLFAWGLTPVMLVGSIVFDYLLAYTVLGIAGIFSKKGYAGICTGVVLALFLRFVSHFISGVVIFKELGQFELFGEFFTNRPFLYSLAYNGLYMLPEIIFTSAAAFLLFHVKQIRKMTEKSC